MPTPVMPTDLKLAVNAFMADHRAQLALAESKAQLSELGAFGRSLRLSGNAQAPLAEQQQGARTALEWMMKVPEALLDNDAAPLVKPASLNLKAAHLAVQDGLQVLTLGVKALLGAGTPPAGKAPQALLQLAFGADAASIALRRPLLDRKAPGLPPAPGLDHPGLAGLPDIDRLVREGTLRELVRTFAECGYAAQMESDWVDHVLPFARVTRLKADPPCAGGQLHISYERFGLQPPAIDQVADIVVALPTRNGCTHVSLRQLDPDFFDPRRWRDAGTLALPLPADVVGGAVGFFSLPPPFASGGPCTGGSLATAAGMFQSVMAKHAGDAYALQFAQQVVDLANRAEAGRHRPLPCAVLQRDRLNLLSAGAAIINGFVVVERGNVHPRGSVTLEWSTFNAQRVEIFARDVAGSENEHQLPPVGALLAPHGRIVLPVPCTRRWEAEYVLLASNDNGCTAQPAQATVRLQSGFSDYRVGCARASVTDRRKGLGMAGFAYKRQTTSGDVLSEQFARAFVVEENSAAPNRQRLIMVVADIWTCTQIVKREVIRRVNERFNRPANDPVVSMDNLLIAGTHTHAGPGGYSEYLLYNLTVGGFEQGVFETIVTGISDAVTHALTVTAPGRIYINAAELPDVGANRSFAAYQRNPEYAAGAGPEQWTDREMLLLKFVVDENNRGRQRPIGALNWHAVHPTSLGQFNRRISGDSKGHAELAFEADIQNRPDWRGGSFVAAFGNGCAGDVSGNLELDAQGNETSFKPLGGELVLLDVLPPMLGKEPPDGGVFPPLLRAPDAWTRDQERMRLLGDRQYQHAIKLFDKATTELTGPLACTSLFLDMARGIPIVGLPGERTWAAALGVSFGAGSTADSIAYATVGPLDIDAAIVEGMTRAEFTSGGIQAWSTGLFLLGTQAPALALALSSGIVPAGPALSVLLQAIALMPGMPLARSYFFASLAPLLLPGEANAQRPVVPGKVTEWEMPMPDSLDAAFVTGHGDKPVMFPVGLSKLRSRPEAGGAWTSVDCPMVPNVVPLQLLRIGSLAVAAVPAEFTATSGRRLKQRLHQAFAGKLSHVAVSNYSNGYSGYVATREEYGAQHYEGASTLYGPHTLDAYLQTFAALAVRLQGGNVPIFGASAPFVAPAIYRKQGAANTP